MRTTVAAATRSHPFSYSHSLLVTQQGDFDDNSTVLLDIVDDFGFLMVSSSPEDGTEVDLYAASGHSNGKALGLSGKAKNNAGGMNKVRGCIQRLKCLRGVTDEAAFPNTCTDDECYSVAEIDLLKNDEHGNKVGRGMKWGLMYKKAGHNLNGHSCNAKRCGRKAEGVAEFGDFEALDADTGDSVLEALLEVNDEAFPAEGASLYQVRARARVGRRAACRQAGGRHVCTFCELVVRACRERARPRAECRVTRVVGTSFLRHSANSLPSPTSYPAAFTPRQFTKTPSGNAFGLLRGKSKANPKKQGPCVKKARCVREGAPLDIDEELAEIYVETDEKLKNGNKGQVTFT